MSACPERSRGARRHFLSLLSTPNLDSLSFLSLAHSFIFRSTPIPCLPGAFRTLYQKAGVYPHLVVQFLSSGTNLQNPPAPDPSVALRASGGRYKTQEGTIYRAPTKRRVDWHRSPVINHQPSPSEAEGSLPLLHLLPLPHLLPVPRVPTLPFPASTTTSTKPTLQPR